MIENEDSVVTSLNELRKLKNERISRQSQSRSVSIGNRAAALAEDPLADQPTPPPAQAGAILAAVRAQAPFDQNAAFAGPAANRFSAGAAGFEHAQISAPPVIRTKTSYTAAVAMTVLLVGAGAAGYMKLQQDTQSLLAAKDAAIKSAEDARMRSVEGATKADLVARNNLHQCEDRLKASQAAASAAIAPAAPAESATASAAAERKVEKASAKATRGSHRAARPARQVAASSARESAKEPKEPKEKGDVPTIAKKKKVDNDPLAGLGKL